MAKKQQKVKPSDIKVGMKCVVNNLPDTYVYTIEAVDGFNVKLSYNVAGRALGGGWIDRSCLLVPTNEQLQNDK